MHRQSCVYAYTHTQAGGARLAVVTRCRAYLRCTGGQGRCKASQSRWMLQELPLPLPAELSVHRSSAKWGACGAWPGFAWGPWRSRREVPEHPPPGVAAQDQGVRRDAGYLRRARGSRSQRRSTKGTTRGAGARRRLVPADPATARTPGSTRCSRPPTTARTLGSTRGSWRGPWAARGGPSPWSAALQGRSRRSSSPGGR